MTLNLVPSIRAWAFTRPARHPPDRVFGLGFLAVALAVGCTSPGSGSHPLQGLTFRPPADAMPAPGSRVEFQAVAQGDGLYHYRWLKDGQPITGARTDTLVLGPVALADAGSYQVQVTDGTTTLASPPFDLQPADIAWTVTSTADDGPGTLRDALFRANGAAGVNGVRFDLGAGDPPSGSYTLRLARSLPPITGTVRIAAPYGHPLILDGGGDPARAAAGGCRPFVVLGGSLTLDGFTVANGLAKGGDGPGGGGGGAGMGGAIFIHAGQVTLARMTFLGNCAQGGDGGSGGDGSGGGGGGFGGDSPDGSGAGADGGVLGGAGGEGVLDGSGPGDPAVGVGGGGGASRGGTLAETDLAQWEGDLEGGEGGWGGGGGFAVGPSGGGGNGRFGGGGGGSGGRVTTADGVSHGLAGGAPGLGGFLGGDGSRGDGVARTGRGGGGAGLGGAVFLHGGTLSLAQCTFIGNRAVGGGGAESGYGKGGAIFIHSLVNRAPLDPALLRAQTYRNNQAGDPGVESPATDNNDFYIAQDVLPAARPGSPLAARYRAHRALRRPAPAGP